LFVAQSCGEPVPTSPDCALAGFDAPEFAFHISNRYRKLSSIVAALAAVVARSEADIANLAATGEWKKQSADRSLRPWTDDFSNVLAVMWRMAGTK